MDIFLSYNSADHQVVEDIARKLRDESLEPFLDRWHLAPGLRWRPRLEETLSVCKAVAIFVGPGEMGSWQQREVDVALDLQARNPKLPVIPVLLPGCEPPLGFLRQLTWVDLRNQALDGGIAILAKAARGEPPGPEIQKDSDSVRTSICPYRGLLHFREEDAPFFFGREAAIDTLRDAVQRQPFVAVVGASGSGKSSVVRAGLVPRLRSDRRTAWETVVLVPTDRPFKALAMALVPLLEPTMGEPDRLEEAARLAEHLRSGTISLCEIVERVLAKQPGTDRVLIVVDQFEELYTLTSGEEARRRFLDELLAASSPDRPKANVALTLRGDFVGRALAYRPLSDRLQDAQINLGPMTRQELEHAIRKPAEKIRLEFESGLVGRILDAVGGEPGNLPLLEFVLMELWEKRRRGVLLNEVYEKIGGLQGAVATKADELFKSFSLTERVILQRIFLRIVRPAKDGLDTRRRAAFSELPPEGAALVLKLANERLLVTNRSASSLERTVEIAHETLISNWSTLRLWVDEDREFLLWRDRLGTLFAEWDRAQQSDEALLRGPLLMEAQKWFEPRSQDLSDQEKKFISVSRAAAEKSRQQQAAAARSLRRLAWVLAAVAFVAVGGAIFGFWQKNESENRKRDAEIANVEARRQEAIAKENANKERISRNAAEEQAQIAETRRLAAQALEKRANDARDQADGLINFMLYDLRDKLEPMGRLDVLDDVTEKAKEYLDNLPNEPFTASRLKQRAGMLDNLGDVRVAQGQLQEGLDAYQEGLTISKRLADQDKSNLVWQRDLSVSYERLGEVLEAQGKLQKALDAFQEGLKITKGLADQDKSNTVWQRDISASDERVGGILVAQGKLQEAQDICQEALAITKRLAEQDKSDTGRQRDLAVSYEKAGEVLVAQGKLQEALDMYQQELVITERLAEQDKSNADWQRTLAISYQKVGEALVPQGKLQEALDDYRQSLNILQTLSDQDKSNAGWQRDLIIALYKVGTVTAKIGSPQNVTQAQAYLRTALDLAKVYTGPDRQKLINNLNLALRDPVHSD